MHIVVSVLMVLMIAMVLAMFVVAKKMDSDGLISDGFDNGNDVDNVCDGSCSDGQGGYCGGSPLPTPLLRPPA